ncbi:hypothetical protein [Streptomyces sp. NPDC093094]|uniref:hypothetical protein n=1 Tax=Streptomyces sp. NPDC093094 TaxID=3366026 RepID=UPI003828BFFA
MSIPDEEHVTPPQEQDALEAAASQVDYYFPVEVVVVGGGATEMKEDILQDVWNALYRALG